MLRHGQQVIWVVARPLSGKIAADDLTFVTSPTCEMLHSINTSDNALWHLQQAAKVCTSD